jgi:hypothetical protein
MLSSLLVSLLLGAPVDQRQLHRADADLYVEMADARAAWTAMQSAPLVSMVSGEPMAKLDKFGQQMGWNLRAALDGLLPQADATRPDDRFWPWSAASSMSMSLSGLEPAGGDMRGLMVADFAEEAAAEQALRAMGSLAAPDARPETVRLFEQDLPVARYKADAMQARLAGWAVRSGARIVAGVGSMEPADLLALSPEASMAAHPARLDDDGLGARSGTLVYRAWSDLEAVGAPEFGALSGVGCRIPALRRFARQMAARAGRRALRDREPGGAHRSRQGARCVDGGGARGRRRHGDGAGRGGGGVDDLHRAGSAGAAVRSAARPPRRRGAARIVVQNT